MIKKSPLILDLFAGPGGTARGIQSIVPHAFYFAIENDPDIAKIHKENNPQSWVIIDDAYKYLPFLHLYDFVWISPPCTTHSRALLFWKNTPHWQEPDERLWEIITIIKNLPSTTKCVVENVTPYYKYPIKETIKIDRHCFWSNFPIKPFDPPKHTIKQWKDRSYKTYWENYHGLKAKDRKSARSMVHPSIAKHIYLNSMEVQK